MCEIIQFVRIALFVICAGLVFTSIICANAYCKKVGVNMNTFEGMLEMYRRVFKFENRLLSILVLFSMYGGALMVLGLVSLTFWGEAQGCDFHINDRSMR